MKTRPHFKVATYVQNVSGNALASKCACHVCHRNALESKIILVSRFSLKCEVESCVIVAIEQQFPKLKVFFLCNVFHVYFFQYEI